MHKVTVPALRGGRRVVHMTNQNPHKSVVGSESGYVCDKVMSLQQPTFDGAKAIVTVISEPHRGEMVTHRLRVPASAQDIMAAFKAVGLENHQPKLIPQGVVSKAWELAKLSQRRGLRYALKSAFKPG